jgi:hypothetical protein
MFVMPAPMTVRTVEDNGTPVGCRTGRDGLGLRCMVQHICLDLYAQQARYSARKIPAFRELH